MAKPQNYCLEEKKGNGVHLAVMMHGCGRQRSELVDFIILPILINLTMNSPTVNEHMGQKS
jgi:predicted esterase